MWPCPTCFVVTSALDAMLRCGLSLGQCHPLRRKGPGHRWLANNGNVTNHSYACLAGSPSPCSMCAIVLRVDSRVSPWQRHAKPCRPSPIPLLPWPPDPRLQFNLAELPWPNNSIHSFAVHSASHPTPSCCDPCCAMLQFRVFLPSGR